jgi:hypothetical protein
VKIFASGMLVAVAIAVALGITTATSGAAAEAHRALGAVPHHAVPHHAGATLRATAAKKAAGFTCGASCSSYKTAIDKYFTDVAAASGSMTNVYGVANQYCQGVATFPPTASCGASPSPISYNSAFGGSYVDGRAYPSSACNDAVTIRLIHYADKFCLTDAQLQNEIKKAIAANGWPTDSTRLFFIFTPANVGICQFAGRASGANECSTNAFCAYHNFTQWNIIYAVVPDDAQIPDGGCDSGSAPVGHGTDASLSSISHEHNEAITDPYLNGWKAADNSENGDLCAYNFGAPLGTTPSLQEYNQVINGTEYWLQQEYSNADNGCLQQPGGTVSPILSPPPGYPPLSGPLVYSGGPVMTTNTVYAIYWIPAAPANTVLPKVAGTTKVGKRLTASRGAWSYSPKSYTYRWLRCSSAGTSCKSIPTATRSAYTLVKTDIRHRVEVRVTATNMAGSANAISAPTNVVTK